MTLITKCLLALLVVTVAGPYSFGGLVLCTEDSVAGCVATLPVHGQTINVASDGEQVFLPLGSPGDDLSDAIQFNSVGGVSWYAYPAIMAFWLQLPGRNTWILDAATPCGIEFRPYGEPGCEPLGAWYASSYKFPLGTPGEVDILEADGSISDQIFLNNLGPGGSAQIIFSSDPGPGPEPGTLILIGTGITLSAKRLLKTV